jgi:hypothetical protein
MEKKPELDASEVLDWNYLCEIAEFVETPKNWNEGVKRFAYSFTSTPSREARNTVLSDLLINAAFKQSTTTTEYIIETLAKSLHVNKLTLKEFASGVGIKVKRSLSLPAGSPLFFLSGGRLTTAY